MDYFSILLLISLSALAPAKSYTNPFTEKAAILRYWNRKIPNSSPHPPFFVSKLTPLSISDAAKFSTIASSDPFKLSSTLKSFCSAAALLCAPEQTSPSLASHPRDSAFSSYVNSNFTNYADQAGGGLSAFKKYFGNEVPLSTFVRYGHGSGGHNDTFTKYGPGNVDTGANFSSYGVNSAGGIDKFHTYGNSTNGAALGFVNYATEATGRQEGFVHYSDDSNVGQQLFSAYAKGGSGTTSDFSTYAHKYSNVIETGFSHYGEKGSTTDIFTTYSEHANIPNNHFDSYGSGTLAGIETFATYRHQSNIGDDSFASYDKNGNYGTADFNNYGNESSGTDAFKGYGINSTNGHISFKSYFEANTTFTDYAKTGIDFKSYHNSSSVPTRTVSKHSEMNLRVEAGKFFRESSLKEGTVMPMPDIHDRFPLRSFLPRSIVAKIPFSVAAVTEIFKFSPGTSMANSVASTMGDCERLPSRGETKRCATSAEDMIDFAVSVLGDDIQVRSTNNTEGSKGNILIGEVKGVNGGKVTESVSCHQSLFPYLVYYCHSVPRVRVYEAEILAVDSKEKINHGIAICHIDTSDWSPTHGAFVALGPGPGTIEVCHWIFEGDMTWTVRDRP